MQLQFLGAAGEVTGSLYRIQAGEHTLLLECGLVQGVRLLNDATSSRSHSTSKTSTPSF